MKKYLKILFLVFLSCLVSFIGGELVLRLLRPNPPALSHSSTRWKLRWLLEHGSRKSRPPEYESVDRFHPEMGHTLKENLRNVALRGSLVNSNSVGSRGVREPEVEKKLFRIIALGDSFTFGECVNDAETFSAQVEKLGKNIEVINLGVHGFGHDQQLLRLRLDGLKFKPDLVILGFFEDDVGRNSMDFRDYMKPKFILQDDRLQLIEQKLVSPEEFASQTHLLFPLYLKLIFERLFRRDVERENETLTRKILNALGEESQDTGARFMLLRLPTYDDLLTQKSPHPLFSELCQRFQCVDPSKRLQDFIRKDPDPTKHFRCHYSSKIHHLVAEEILANLLLH